MTEFELNYTVDLVSEMYNTRDASTIQTKIKEVFNQDVELSSIKASLNVEEVEVNTISLKKLFTIV